MAEKLEMSDLDIAEEAVENVANLDIAEEALENVVVNHYQSFPFSPYRVHSSDKDKIFSGPLISKFLNCVAEVDKKVAEHYQVENLVQTMTDKDYAPLSSHCVRALCDKMYDKRKAAALEIEK